MAIPSFCENLRNLWITFGFIFEVGAPKFVERESDPPIAQIIAD
jgi:hypothetical protein